MRLSHLAIVSLFGVLSRVTAQTSGNIEFVYTDNAITGNWNGVSMGSGFVGTYISGQSSSMSFDIPGAPSGIKCSPSGDIPQGATVTFTMSDGANYLYPCGPNNGVTLTCTPVAICE